MESRDFLEVHARDLQVRDAVVTVGARTLPGTLALDPEREVCTLHFAEALPIGAATLTLAFQGQLNKALRGLYLAQDGPEQLLSTQCEATDARGDLPLLGRAGVQGALRLTITTSAGVTVLSNGPLRRARPAATGNTHLDLRPDPAHVELPGRAGDRRLRRHPGSRDRRHAVASLGAARQGADRRFAQEFTKRLLPFYEEYFDFPYPFAKYDQVAVPGFDAGAMENIGLVLFRQNLLLMDPATASWRQEKLIAKVIAHEFAHMWFGNLVTMRWWDDLWLNEAFAEWMATRRRTR